MTAFLRRYWFDALVYSAALASTVLLGWLAWSTVHP